MADVKIISVNPGKKRRARLISNLSDEWHAPVDP